MSDGKHRKRLAAAEAFVRKIPQPFRSSLSGPSAVSKFFARQSDALAFASTFRGDLLVFAFESSTIGCEGQRRFLACSAQCFFHEYKQLDEKFRHYYEVIAEDTPCKLYCDLEFCIPSNPDLDGKKLTQRFIQVLELGLEVTFGRRLDSEDIVVLDASSPEKFSKHLIFPRAIFANNQEMGIFLKVLHASLKELAFGEASASFLCPDCSLRATKLREAFLSLNPPSSVTSFCDFFVMPKPGSNTDPSGPRSFFCDLAVYSRNRNFRLLDSSKLVPGPARPLKPDPTWNRGQKDEALFYRSLITFGVAAPFLQLPWVCKCRGTWSQSRSEPGSAPSVSSDPPEGLSGFGSSLFPEIDAFLESEVLKGVGRVRRWSYLPQRELLTFDLAGHRFCHRLGRPHRSNNVMYVVDLRRRRFYQKCLDPDCRAVNYRSEEWTLPEEVLPWFGMLDDEEERDGEMQGGEEEDVEEHILLEMLRQAESNLATEDEECE